MVVGEVFLGAFLQVLFEKLASPVLAAFLKWICRRKTHKTIQQWQRPLMSIQQVQADAEQKQFTSDAIKNWLRDLQDLAYDIEDVLELFECEAHAYDFNNNNNTSAHPRCLASAKNTVKRLPILLKPINRGIQSKIDDITSRLENIDDQIRSLRLAVLQINPQQTLQTEALRNQRESTSLASKVFGRDDVKEEIITCLLKDDEQTQQSNANYVMIPIVGTGGIGKTTLAQHVYNDDRLKDQFDLKAWVCVSDVFDVKRIITKICKEAPDGGTVVDFTTLDEAQKGLRQVLMGKKFFIVLDDIWNEIYQYWDNLQTPFQNAAMGSRVIVTTRTESIAKLMNSNSKHDNIIHIKGLLDDACWDIVQQHAGNKTDLVEMRVDIISKCKGLPLAAKVLGGILKTKDIRECRQMLNSDLWSENENSVLPVLRLSYYHLPSHLKRVFAYCSIFPKDTEFKEMVIVSLWMAQGLLPENQGMETTVQNYLHELVQRSLLEVDSSSEQVFTMHDLIHDLALWAAGDICHVMDPKDIMEVSNKRARHVILTKVVATTLGSRFPMASQLRTLDCNLYGGSSIKSLDFIQKFRCIRALMLTSKTIEVLPDCIWDLKLLRFLYLNTPCIKEVSKLINNLWNLQTLILINSEKLNNIPNIGSLIKLRCLDVINGTSLQEMPRGIGNLTNLHSVSEFVLGNGHGSRIGELKNLNNLHGKLRICGLEKVSNAEDAKQAQLHEKCGLDELSLEWKICEGQVDDEKTQGDVVEQLKPPTSIKKCKLDGYMGLELPAWLGDPSFANMVAMQLENLKKCKGLLPHLPHLKTLNTEECKEMSISLPGLPSLVELVVTKCEKLRITSGDSCELPYFTRLKISRCPNMVFCSPGHLYLPVLKEIEILWCVNMESLPSQMLTCTSLQQLRIEVCPKLECIPEGGLPISLQKLHIEDAKINGAVQESWGLHCLHSLESLYLWGVESEGEDMCVPSSLCEILIRRMRNLKNVRVGGDGNYCTNLTSLKVFDCPDLETLVGNFTTSLKNLHLAGCPKLESLSIPQGIGILNSLEVLELNDVGSSIDGVETIPGPHLDLPSSLCNLTISGFQNLKSIKCSALPNLASLRIRDCPKFEIFDENALPPKLKEVRIVGCDHELIKPHLKSDPHGPIRLGLLFGRDRYSLA